MRSCSLRVAFKRLDQLDHPVAREPGPGYGLDRHVAEAARLLAYLLRRADHGRPGHLAEREDELVRLMLCEEVVREDDRRLLEVDPLEGEAQLRAGM